MILLLISLVFGILHGLFWIFHFYEILLMAQEHFKIIQLQTTVLISMPYLVIFILAVVFNALGYFLKHYPFTLTATILYSLAGIVSIKMIPFALFESSLCILGLVNFRKKSISHVM